MISRNCNHLALRYFSMEDNSNNFFLYATAGGILIVLKMQSFQMCYLPKWWRWWGSQFLNFLVHLICCLEYSWLIIIHIIYWLASFFPNIFVINDQKKRNKTESRSAICWDFRHFIYYQNACTQTSMSSLPLHYYFDKRSNSWEFDKLGWTRILNLKILKLNWLKLSYKWKISKKKYKHELW